jgi:hypothetical protein
LHGGIVGELLAPLPPPATGTSRSVALRITTATTNAPTVAIGIHTIFRRGRHLAIARIIRLQHQSRYRG